MRRAHKLSAGLWAVGHDEHDDAGLRASMDRVIAAGGVAEASVVGTASAEDVQRWSQLTSVCEHTWDDFFNRVDRLAAETQPSAATFAAIDERIHMGEEVDALRQRYADLAAADLALSGAMQRAGDRLDVLVTHRRGAAGVARTSARSVVEVTTGFALDSGEVRYLATVSPFPGLAWDVGFRSFESMVYRPDANRVPLRHGVFEFRAVPEVRDEVLESMRRRIRRFEQSLA